jgi:hypothetical protein
MRGIQELFRLAPWKSVRRDPSQRSQLMFEALETRLAPASVFVVPLTQTADSSHFHTLAEAVVAAGARGIVTIEPGASEDPTPNPVQPMQVTQVGITIRGNPSVPATVLPNYQIQILTSEVHLENLNLNAIALGAPSTLTPPQNAIFSNGNNISKCLIHDITGFDNASTFSQNTITGVVSISSSFGDGFAVFENNVFSSAATNVFSIFSALGVVVRENTFNVRGNATAIRFINSGSSGSSTIISNNVISFGGSAGTGARGIDIEQNSIGVSDAQVLNNAINTNGRGTGMSLAMSKGDNDHFRFFAQGNDFHNNAVGVAVRGDGTICGNIDLGLGAIGSLGGNNFRGFTDPASPADAAIVITNATNGSVFAQQCIFSSGIAPESTVFAQQGPGFIFVDQPLSSDRAFVQTLYDGVLGRTGTLAELDGWVGLLNTPGQGQAAVASGIQKSSEALGRIVDQLYLRFLGRQSDANGRNGWVNFLAGGGTLEQVETLFLTSPEYLGHINTDFVQSLYLNILGRAGRADELALWNNNIQNLGLTGIANGFISSTENRVNTLRSDFQTFLHRTPANTELAPLASLSLDLLTLQGLVLSSPEFFANG